MFKKKMVLAIIFIILIICGGFLSKVYATEKSSQENSLEVKYQYDKDKNQVIVQIVSDIELKNTKPTWKLSEDKMTYTKTYSENMDYTTLVEDKNGKVTSVPIKITQIQQFKATVSYEYLEETNQVLAKIVSNVELKQNKPTWQLSEDKKTYSKLYSANSNYSTHAEDINGNVKNVNIQITQVKKFVVKTEYKYDENTNQVEVILTSNVKLKNTKPTWKLSEDQMSYSKLYSENMDYTTLVEDINGNVETIRININKIDVTPPKITLEYKYNEDDTVTVYMKSNEKLGETKPTWQLSADKLTYQKIFDADQNYSTLVEDRYGNKTNVVIDFKIRQYTYKQEDESTIKVRYLYIGKKEARVEIISSIKMQDTKPTWKLSSDGYTYTKTFNSNNIYGTQIKDINGVVKNVNIIVNMFDDYLLGIDVSHHNGTIDWETVKKSGIDFAIIRCGFGQDMTSQDDKMFEYNVKECERLGIPYGIYLYSYATDTKAASSEADHVLRLVKGHKPQYGIWYDLEEETINADFVSIAITFCEKIKQNGYNKIGIYANLYWWNYKLNDSRLDKYDKWVAQWGNSCDYDKQYNMWQYSSTGIVKGISTNVDMNILYK